MSARVISVGPDRVPPGRSWLWWYGQVSSTPASSARVTRIGSCASGKAAARKSLSASGPMATMAGHPNLAPWPPSPRSSAPVLACRWRELVHLQRLVASWNMLADFCFSDLLLFVPLSADDASGDPDDDPDEREFVVVGHVRPSTTQTLYRHDLIGEQLDESERPLVARAMRLGEIIEGEITIAAIRERVRVLCIPVRHDGKTIAVLSRESTPVGGPVAGRARAHLRRHLQPVRPHDRRRPVPVPGRRQRLEGVAPRWATASWCSTGRRAWSTPRPTRCPPCTAWASTPASTGCGWASSASTTNRCATPSPWASRSPRRSSGAT